MKALDWTDKVALDFRSRIIVDPDSPILAFKANRDRYTRGTHPGYEGLPYLGSQDSEDAVTWNVFRSLQKARRLDIVCNELDIGQPRAMLLWTLAPEMGTADAELQYAVGSTIRRFDGVLRGQMTEPDVILLGSAGIAVIECKLSGREQPPSHLWEGSPNSVQKRLAEYQKVEPGFVKGDAPHAVAQVYQLVRMAFYALQLGKTFGCPPVAVSLANEKNWHRQIRRLGESPAQLWTFFADVIETPGLRKQELGWQCLRELIAEQPLDDLSLYLCTHPCL